MSPDKDATLCRKYPMLYAQRTRGMRETSMCWGFECGDGWFALIDRLSAALEAINKTLPNGQKVEAVQVKTKYGGLRFYTNGAPYGNGAPIATCDRVDNLILAAEDESYRTCEQCGKRGKSNAKGWIETLCDECRAKTRS